MICIIGYFTRKNQNFTVICSSKKIELSDRKSLLYPSPAFRIWTGAAGLYRENHI